MALVVAHLRQCADCRNERASLEQMVASFRQRTASPRAALQSFGKTIDAIRSVAIVGATSLVDLAARRLGRLPGLVTRAVGTSTSGWEVAGRLIAHLADLRVRLRTSLMAAHRWAARSAEEIIRRGVTLALELLTQVRRTLPILSARSGRIAALVVGAIRSVIPPSINALAWLHARRAFAFTVARRAMARTLGASRVGAIWMADRIASGISAVRHRREITRSEFLTLGRKASETRPLLAACAGIVSLAILAATIMSPRSPVNRLPADTSATPQPAKTSVSEPSPSPVGAAAPSEPTARRVAMRVKRVDGGPPIAGSTATAPAPVPAAEGARSAEPSDGPDAFAAVDWLLRGRPGR